MRKIVSGLVSLAACSPTPPAPPPDLLSVATPYELTTLDPHRHDKLGVFAVLTNVYEPLVGMDADMKIQPALARSWESPDSRTWLFHLRPDVRFHSGRTLRASDVVHSFNRVLEGVELEVRNYLLGVVSVSALDDTTVQLRTDRPSRILLAKLVNLLVVPEGSGAELGARADGTGPYRLAEWRRGSSVRLARHSAYWRGPPAVPQVELHLDRGPEAALAGLQAGRHHLAQCDSKKLPEALAGQGRYQVVRRDNLFVKYLGFDLARRVTPHCPVKPNPFRDRRVRQAIHLGLQRHRLVRDLWNYAVPATQPVPRFVFGFHPAIPEAEHDLGRARALLAEAGLPAGFPVVLHTRRVLQDAAELVGRELSPLGIAVEVRSLPDPEFFEALTRREASFWLNRFGCATGDASDFLDGVVHSVGADRRYGTLNYGGFADRGIDAAIEASAGMDDLDQRRGALQSLMQRVMHEMVVVPLYSDQDVYAVDRALAWRPRSDSYILAAEIGYRR